VGGEDGGGGGGVGGGGGGGGGGGVGGGGGEGGGGGDGGGGDGGGGRTEIPAASSTLLAYPGHPMIVNLTGHPLRLTDGQSIVTIPPVGRVRVVSASRHSGDVEIEGLDRPLPLTKLTASEVVGLPEPADGVIYVVSGMVAAQVPEREDVVAPGRIDRDPATRRVIGCRGFVKSIR
jgi:hypothetical protein